MFTIVLTTLLNVYLLTFQMFTIELTALLNVYLPGNVFETFAHWNIVHLQVYSISFFFCKTTFLLGKSFRTASIFWTLLLLKKKEKWRCSSGIIDNQKTTNKYAALENVHAPLIQLP